jgi:hypothetical protein
MESKEATPNGERESPAALLGFQSLGVWLEFKLIAPRETMTPLLKDYTLDADKLIATIASLSRRITARFPEAGLSGLCQQLLEISRNASERSEHIRRPSWPLRFLAYGIIAVIVAVLVLTIISTRPPDSVEFDLSRLVELLEAGINDVVLIGAAIFFLVSLENRHKRKLTLEAIRELRAIAHVIDMHQLTKDPDRILGGREDNGDPEDDAMTPFQLRRYLDYCSEMLSLTGKIASLYSRHFEDQVTVAAVNEIEELTTGLSRKIWQKIISSQALNS